MKTEKNILIAFLLNLTFSVFEFFGGIFTGSVAIVSDAMHDMADALSIGISYLLEKKSRKQPDDQYTYGYARYSVLGSVITNSILLFGSVAVIAKAVGRIITPADIHYNGMILFAIVGVLVNLAAALVTRGDGSMNQKAVNLHMLEDVLGWLVVLVGGILIGVTGFTLIDPILSIGVALFILISALRNLKQITQLLLGKVPEGIQIREIREQLTALDGVVDVHHLHIWSLDGQRHCATMHVVTTGDPPKIRQQVRETLHRQGIGHVTLELEKEGEPCPEEVCRVELHTHCDHHHHHHHHH